MFKRKEMLLCANVWAPGEKMCITPNKRDLLLFFKLFVYGLWPFSLLYVWSTQDSKRLCIILILSTLFLSHKQCFVLKLYFPGSDAVFTPERAVYSTLFYSLTNGFKEKGVYFTAFYEASAEFCCRRRRCTSVMRVPPLSSAHKQGLFSSIDNMLTTGPRHTHNLKLRSEQCWGDFLVLKFSSYVHLVCSPVWFSLFVWHLISWGPFICRSKYTHSKDNKSPKINDNKTNRC